MYRAVTAVFFVIGILFSSCGQKEEKPIPELDEMVFIDAEEELEDQALADKFIPSPQEIIMEEAPLQPFESQR